MSQTPNPHDPYGTEPGTPDSAPQTEQGAPTSDPALHPHDPYAYSPDPAAAPASDAGTGSPAQDPYAGGPQPFTAGAGASHSHGGQAPYTAPHGGPTGQGPSEAPAGTAGVYDGPLTGQVISGSDSRLWATLSQAAVALGHVVSWGFLGWVGPLVIFLMYKDRDRFVRFHAAEALNGAIAVFIAQVVLTIAIAVGGLFTFGIGWALFPLAGLPALLQLVFSIIGAVKANQGQWWGYPLNLRLVK